MSEEFDFKTKELDGLIKALKNNMSRVRVGILGAKAMRSGQGQQQGVNNATIGAQHEFGNSRYPQRSFLRMPITDNLQREVENSGVFTKDALLQVLKDGSLKPWLQKLGVLGEKIVSDAFDTSGFGKWPKWKTPGYQSNTGQILVDTQQLRNSITSDVK